MSNMTFGQWMKMAREIQQLRQQDVADSAGLDFSYISFLERDKRKPTLETAEKVALALGVPLWQALRHMESTQ